jgi:hypothetical protein
LQANKFYAVSGYHSADVVEDDVDVGQDSFCGLFFSWPILVEAYSFLTILKMVAASSSKMSVTNYHLTHCHIPEDYKLPYFGTYLMIQTMFTVVIVDLVIELVLC